jgi:hypothetical protein
MPETTSSFDGIEAASAIGRIADNSRSAAIVSAIFALFNDLHQINDRIIPNEI